MYNGLWLYKNAAVPYNRQVPATTSWELKKKLLLPQKNSAGLVYHLSPDDPQAARITPFNEKQEVIYLSIGGDSIANITEWQSINYCAIAMATQGYYRFFFVKEVNIVQPPEESNAGWAVELRIEKDYWQSHYFKQPILNSDSPLDPLGGAGDGAVITPSFAYPAKLLRAAGRTTWKRKPQRAVWLDDWDTRTVALSRAQDLFAGEYTRTYILAGYYKPDAAPIFERTPLVGDLVYVNHVYTEEDLLNGNVESDILLLNATLSVSTASRPDPWGRQSFPDTLQPLQIYCIPSTILTIEEIRIGVGSQYAATLAQRLNLSWGSITYLNYAKNRTQKSVSIPSPIGRGEGGMLDSPLVIGIGKILGNKKTLAVANLEFSLGDIKARYFSNYSLSVDFSWAHGLKISALTPRGEIDVESAYSVQGTHQPESAQVSSTDKALQGIIQAIGVGGSIASVATGNIAGGLTGVLQGIQNISEVAQTSREPIDTRTYQPDNNFLSWITLMAYQTPGGNGGAYTYETSAYYDWRDYICSFGFKCVNDYRDNIDLSDISLLGELLQFENVAFSEPNLEPVAYDLTLGVKFYE